MNKEEFIQHLRNNRVIKGNRPSFVYLKKNFGKIYNGKKSNFVLSIKKNELYFQKVTFFQGLRPNEDFVLDINDFKHFKFISYNMIVNVLYLYDKDRNFIEIFYDCKRKDSYETETNMNDIVKRLVDLGLTELPEEIYDEESND